MFRRFRTYMASPIVVALRLLGGLLSVAMLVAGIGMFSLQPWGRTLILWQAGLSLAMIVVSLVVQQQVPVFLPSPQGMSVEDQQRVLGTLRIFNALWQLGTGLVWNGLLLWFFNRPSVKAQFQHTAAP